MKQITTVFMALLLLIGFSGEVQAQKKSKNKKSQADTTSLSYNYGLLLAMSLQMQGVPADSIKASDVLAGFEMGMKKGTDQEAFKKSQEIFSKKMDAIMAEAALKEKDKAKEKLAKEKAWFESNGKKPNIVTLPSGLQYEVLKEGNGEKPTPTSKVTTHYHGTLLDGTVFDSSYERNEPATFPVNGVIKGWQEVLPLMKTGSKWKVYIPSELAYGSRDLGTIPPNSTLIFEIELIRIEK